MVMAARAREISMIMNGTQSVSQTDEKMKIEAQA
jgi:hypothetical protein